MRNVTKVILVLGCVSLFWMVQSGKGGTTIEKNAAIEKAILKVHMEMVKAAENLDADTLFKHVLESDLPDDPYLTGSLGTYFPSLIQ